MKFKNCITRLFFRDPNPQRSYRLDEIIAKLQTYGRDAYDVVRKSSFCVDLKEGCARGLGKVRSIIFVIFFSTYSHPIPINATECNQTLTDNDICWEGSSLTRMNAYRIFLVSQNTK